MMFSYPVKNLKGKCDICGCEFSPTEKVTRIYPWRLKKPIQFCEICRKDIRIHVMSVK